MAKRTGVYVATAFLIGALGAGSALGAGGASTTTTTSPTTTTSATSGNSADNGQGGATPCETGGGTPASVGTTTTAAGTSCGTTSVTGSGGGPTTSKPKTAASTSSPSKVLVTSATGRAAVRTESGLLWITVNLNTAGTTKLTVSLASRKISIKATSGLKTSFGVNRVGLTGHGISLTITKTGTAEHVAFKSAKVSANGRIVSGSFKLV